MLALRPLLFVAPAAHALALPDSFSAGRTAVVTGAAAGLGKAAALKCAELGMNVCLVDVDEARLAEAAVSVAKANDEVAVMAECLDVSDREAVMQLSDDVYEQFGEVGFLLSNAGAGTGSPSALQDFDKWARSLDVNLYSCLHVLQAFVPRMLEQKNVCTVVTTGSKQGITTPPGNLAYNVAKSGVKIITEGLQHELRSSADNEGRVQAHLFVPGFVNTNLAYNCRPTWSANPGPANCLLTAAHTFVPRAARTDFKELKGESFDPEKDVPWSEEKPSQGGWMPGQTIEYLFDELAAGSFYIICPDNDVSSEMDAKRIAWAAGDMVVRDTPLSRWDPAHKEAFAAYMADGAPADALLPPEEKGPKFCLNVKLCIKPERRDEFLECIRDNQVRPSRPRRGGAVAPRDSPRPPAPLALAGGDARHGAARARICVWRGRRRAQHLALLREVRGARRVRGAPGHPSLCGLGGLCCHGAVHLTARSEILSRNVMTCLASCEWSLTTI